MKKGLPFNRWLCSWLLNAWTPRNIIVKPTLTMVLAIIINVTFAQERTVSGKVSDNSGTGLPGVNIVLKGTAVGTVSDANGDFAIKVPSSGSTLVLSAIGWATTEVVVGEQSTINVTLSEDVTQLSEVVVTALNITRDKASLGYSTQTVGGDQVSTVKQQNFVNSLSGKIAGVQIRTAGQFGGSTNIVIRGNKSVSGNNQPLFVVDGVPIDNRTGNSTFQEAGRMGFDYGNSTSDINPEDIESINVLKGAGAAALYGSRAANGVVMITTKKGSKRKGIGVQISTGITAGQVNPDTFVKYQKKYGAGYAAPSFEYYGTQGFFEEDIDGDGNVDLIVPSTEDASYGAQFDPNLMVYHWDSFVPESPNYMKKYGWNVAKHMPDEFFKTQMEYNNSVALSGGNDNTTFRLAYTNYTADGYLPKATQKRHNISFTGATSLTQKLNVSLNANYIFAETVGRPSTGYGDNQMANFRQWWETNVDIKSLQDMYEKTGRNVTWNPANYWEPDVPIFWDNPYWTRYKNYQSDDRSRIFGNITLNYKLTDWLSVMGRTSLDTYTELREERRAIGSVPTEFGLLRADGSKPDQASGYQREDRNVTETNYDLFLNFNKTISSDLSIAGMIGTNVRKQHFRKITAATNGGLVIPDLYSLNNSALGVLLPNETDQRKQVVGFLGNVNLGWKNMIYIDASARNDISSALPVQHNSYFYHSEGISFLLNEMFEMPKVDFLKLRVNYAEVGNDTDPENTTTTYTRADNMGSAVIYSFPTTVANSNLLPERTKSWEVGMEYKGFNNRLTLDMSLYKTNTVNQIIQVETSKSSGMGFKFINGGDIQNKGIELALGYDIIKNNNFSWNARVNWTKNISEVISLGSGDIKLDNYVINSYQGNISTNVTVGSPYGVLRGLGYQYLNGQRVINGSGYYVAVADQVIGNPNPKWLGGLLNSFTYKGVNASFLIDMSRGGDVFSLDMYYGMATGVLDRTAGLNDLGNPVRDPVDEGGGVLNKGVLADGSENTTRARADFYGGAFYWGNNTRNPAQMSVFDASYVKLRELSIGYSLPSGILPSAFRKVTLSMVGRNLWIIHKNLPYADPESGLGAGNGQGYSSGAYPSLRTLGFKLDLDF